MEADQDLVIPPHDVLPSWDKVRGLFVNFPVADRETLYEAIAFGYRDERVVHDTS